MAVCLPAQLQPVEPGSRLGQGVPEERHEQQGLRIAVQDGSELAVFDLPAGQIEDGAVNQLNGGGLAGQCVLRRLDCRLCGREMAHGDDPVRRRGHQLDSRLDDGDQGALGAHHELCQIEATGPGRRSQPGRPSQPVQPVAAGLPPEPGVAGGDGVGVAFDEAGQLPADGPVERRRGSPATQLSGRERAERRAARVGQDHVQCEHMVDRHAVPDRMAAR